MEGGNQLRVYDRIPDEKWLWLALVESGKNFPCETQNKNGQETKKNVCYGKTTEDR